MGEVVPARSWHPGKVIEPPIPLVWAKLKQPMLPKNVVDRSSLVASLADTSTALTAIVAPAGYGKTTTAVQLLGRLGDRVAWLSLEPADSSPARFWTYVAAALASAGVDGADVTYKHLAEDGIEAATLALRAAIEMTEAPVTLVLDDLHVIESDAVPRQLSSWLRHPVPNLRLICTSRSQLPLPVGRLRGQGLLTEARIDELAFSDEESAALLSEVFGLSELTSEQVRTLDRRTQGWPVGLYLAGLALRDDPDVDRQLERFAGDTRHLTEYLAVEAMDGVDADVRAFVLATSIVSVLDPDLCDAITGQVGSLKTLRQLVADNVFTSALDSASMVFHYHPLFREHLQSALASEHPELVGELHARASRWYESRGELDEAISHATKAGDIDRAQQLISSTSSQFSNAGHFDTVINWVTGLGDSSRLSAEIALLMSWTMLNLRRYDDLDRWMGLAQEAASDPAIERIVALQTPTLRAHRARHVGDVGKMLQHGGEALSHEGLYPGAAESAHLFLRTDAGRGAAFSVMGSALFWCGDLDQSYEHLIAGLAIARSTEMLIEVIFCYSYLAMLETERDDAEAAIAHADQALGLVAEGQERHLQPTLAHVARSIAHLSQGRPADAESDLIRAKDLAASTSEPLIDLVMCLQEARLSHRTGDIEAARALVREARTLAGSLPDPRFDERLRSVEADIRFVARDVEDLPIGARELTDREQAVLELLPHGLARKELAAQLHVSENTIKTHLTSIRHKLGISGRASIVDKASELGMLQPKRSR